MDNQMMNQPVMPDGLYAAPTKFCGHCGAMIPGDAVICASCGTQQQPEYAVNPMQQMNPMQAQMNQMAGYANPGFVGPTKFCKHCGTTIAADAVICTACGRQVEMLAQQNQPAPQVVIHNNPQSYANANANANAGGGTMKNKWTAVLLCLFLGSLGVHKFYEGKILMGLLYLCTFGLFGIGTLVDLIILLGKPNPYYLK